MKAFQFRKYNGPLELTESPTPGVSENEVLIKVHAASLNQLDEMIRVGTFKATLPYDLPQTLGSDLAGEIVQVGSNVTRFKVGDQVYSKPNPAKIGSFAEFIAVPESELALKPANLSMIESASLPLVGLTAWQALQTRGRLKAGQKVLIHGGAGGVGSIAIQLAKHLGATVATTASAANADFVRELGADFVIDYKNEDFSKTLKEFDLVLDTQGGETLMKSLEVLKVGSKVIGIAGPPDVTYARSAKFNLIIRTIFKLLSSKVIKRAKALGVNYEFLFVNADREQLQHLAKLFESKALRPVVGRVFAFNETPEALTMLATGKIGRGKAVVSIFAD